MLHRVDPELREGLEAFLGPVGGSLDLSDIVALRAKFADLTRAAKAELPPVEGVTSEDGRIPGPPGAPEVALRLYRPSAAQTPLPALLWMHGGGYVLGSVEDSDLTVRQLCKDLDCLIVAVEYRLAPENPFPAGMDDCYAALQWLATHASEIGARSDRLVIAGSSAGGGLTAGLALLARDRGEVKVTAQFPLYPMIDDRNIAQASEAVADTLLWSRANNLVGWRAYLGDAVGGEVSPYAAAFRATDVAGLPLTYLPIGELDLFLHETIEYAQRLFAAGVPTELHVYPGGYHAFEQCAPEADVSRRFTADLLAAFRRALHG
jgi:acetyl esterase/lipase